MKENFCSSKSWLGTHFGVYTVYMCVFSNLFCFVLSVLLSCKVMVNPLLSNCLYIFYLLTFENKKCSFFFSSFGLEHHNFHQLSNDHENDLKVALENSDSRRVELNRVNLDTSGTYMCEVISSIIILLPHIPHIT